MNFIRKKTLLFVQYIRKNYYFFIKKKPNEYFNSDTTIHLQTYTENAEKISISAITNATMKNSTENCRIISTIDDLNETAVKLDAIVKDMLKLF